MVDMLREAGIGGGGTETERYLRIAMLRFLLLQRHDWTDEIAERLAGRGQAPERGRGGGHDDPPDPQGDAGLAKPIRVHGGCRTSTPCVPRCAPTTSAALARGRGDEAFAVASSASSPSCATRSFALVRRRPALRGRVGALLDAIARDRRASARASCACSTTSARSRRTGSSASRRSAT